MRYSIAYHFWSHFNKITRMLFEIFLFLMQKELKKEREGEGINKYLMLCIVLDRFPCVEVDHIPCI